MKEIGGYFGFERLLNNQYHEGLVRLNTARNAFLYLCRSKLLGRSLYPLTFVIQ